MRNVRPLQPLSRRRSPAVAPRGDAGFSLVEGLIAALLLLFVALGVIPLFTRAMESNISGHRSSHMSTFVSALFEEENQLPIDRDEWNIAAEPDGVKTFDLMYWVTGRQNQSAGIPDTSGDEKWTLNPVPVIDGLVIWQRDVSVRKYSLSDLQILAGTDPSDDEIVAFGHPMLLDSPLTDDRNSHITEIRVSMKENRRETPLGAGRRITVGHFRVF